MALNDEPAILIRSATVNDIPSLAQIYLSCHESDEALDLDTVIQRKAAIYFGTSKDILHDIYIAYSTQNPQECTGYISVIRNSTDLPGRGSEVDYLYVLPEHQGKGIGGRLLDRVRRDNQCESWVRCDRNMKDGIEWFKKKGYRYQHTEIGHDRLLTVLCWPGTISRRPATIHDIPSIHSLFVESVFSNPEIAHNTSVPSDFLETVTTRLFPSPDSGLTSIPTIYYSSTSDPSRILGVSNMHLSSSSSSTKQVELNMFFTNKNFASKDLGHTMLSHIIQIYSAKYAIAVKTWAVNKRAVAFYKKNGFLEIEREDEELTRREENRPAKVTLVRPGPPSLES